jgi:hypothetical protein
VADIVIELNLKKIKVKCGRRKAEQRPDVRNTLWTKAEAISSVPGVRRLRNFSNHNWLGTKALNIMYERRTTFKSNHY